MAQNVVTSMYFLKRDPLYTTEKPYALNYDPPPGFKRSNVTLEKCENLEVEDIRGRQGEFSFIDNGFTIMNVDIDMSPTDFNDREKVIRLYVPAIAHHVKEKLCATRVQIFDHIVRKRQAQFPTCTGRFYQYKQPSSIVHTDTTPEQTRLIIKDLNPGEAEDLLKMRYQYVNVWKPLRGPVRDWPLAMCDPRTIQPDCDLQPRDIVDPDSFIETYQVHRVPTHRWYYVSDQMPEEAWLFLQSDSSSTGMPGVPHSSFPNPLASSFDPLRESIELRALVFYDERITQGITEEEKAIAPKLSTLSNTKMH